MSPITPVSGIVPSESIRPAGVSGSEGGFQEVFSSAIRSVEGLSADASASVERFLSGEGEELHTTVLATQKAELAFEMFMQARNKVVNAYQEIMRMQV
jgi:flagellar hook-basal body complex protein FliE